jgi:fibrillarin-like pre-rRNA processing protein
MKNTQYPNIFEKNDKYYIKAINRNPLFNEKVVDKHREFDPTRSKFAAAIKKGIKKFPINIGDKILYLGASHGYTPSFMSDLVGKEGMIFCIEFAPRVAKDLVFVCEQRINMAPILADANKPEIYKDRIIECDILYQDIAQKNQVEIFFKNLKYIKRGGYCLLAVKSRSIDVTQEPAKIYAKVEEKLKTKLTIIDSKKLDPLENDHCLFLCQKP